MCCRQSLSWRSRAGFTTLEYAILVAALIFGLLAAQTYLTRAVSSKWRDTADAFGSGRQLKTDGAGATVVVRTEF